MKKYFYSLFAAASMMLAVTSCSQEEELVPQSDNVTSFSIQLDGATQSRSVGDGMTVDKLYYAVYSDKTNELVPLATYGGKAYGVADISKGSCKLDLPLMKSETYDVLFWAQKDGSNAYTFDNLKAINVNYDGVLSNKENRDAFFNALDGFTASGSEHVVVLRRPFAQLNIATTLKDWEDAKTIYNNTNGTTGVDPVTKSSVKVIGLAKTFDVLSGKAVGNETVVFAANVLDELKNEDGNNPFIVKRMVNGAETDVEYKLLAMNYLLPVADDLLPDGLNQHNAAAFDKAKDIVEVEFTLYKGDNTQIVNVKVPSTPIQRNYRTNIIGDLLTGEHFDIIVDSEFDKDDANQEIEISADGIVKDDAGIYHITKKEGLYSLANLVNYGSTSSEGRAAKDNYTFTGKTFVLDCDIDLDHAEWNPIGNGETSFQGTFDGNNKTVSNFKVTEKEGWVGLFGNVKSGAVKNLTVKNVILKAYHYAGAIVGQGYVNIDNCHVENVTITLSIDPEADNGKGDFGDKAGGIIGQNCEGGKWVKDCSAKNVTITGYRDLGGIMGMAHNNNIVEGNTVENIKIVQDTKNGYQNATPATLGAVIGRRGSNVTENENTGEAEIIKLDADDYKGYYQDANGNYCVTANAGIAAAIADGATEMTIKAGEYTALSGVTSAVTINCEEGTVFKGKSSLDVKGSTVIGATFSNDSDAGAVGNINGTFKDCTFTGNNEGGVRWAYTNNGDVTFENCTFGDDKHLRSFHVDAGDGSITFKGCTFYGFTALGDALPLVKFEDCEFKYSSYSNGDWNVVNMYANYEYVNCKFDPSMHTDCAGNGVVATFTNCSYTDGSDLRSIVRFDKDPATCTITIDGLTFVAAGAWKDAEGNYIVSNNDELIATIKAVVNKSEDSSTIKLLDGTYDNDIALTVAALGKDYEGNLVFKAADGANPIIAGTVTLGYRKQGTGAAMWNSNVTFEGISFDHAEAGKHSLDVQDVKSLNLKNCKIIGDGEYGIGSASGNATGTSKIEGCTFENAGMQLLGNFATGLIIDNCTFTESRINVQGGNSVTVQNCTFNNTLTAANVGDSFYMVRSNSTPITVKDSQIYIDSSLTEVAVSQAKWYVFANRGTTNWTVENVAVTMTEEALKQTELKVTACTSTGVINTNNLTVNGKVFASTEAQLLAAIENGATDIVLAGEIKMPSNAISKNITFSGLNASAVIDNTKGSYWENATLTFNNIKFKTGTGKVNGNGADYAALYSKDVTYYNCSFSGPMRLGRDGAEFKGCTFNDLGNDYVWTYGNDATFEGCTFNSEGKALLIYSDGGTEVSVVSVKNCTFNATQGAKAGAIANQNCAAIEIHNYGNGVNLTTEANTIDNDFSGVWRIKTYESGKPQVYVNGTEYTTIALDGKTMSIDANKNVTVNN